MRHPRHLGGERGRPVPVAEHVVHELHTVVPRGEPGERRPCLEERIGLRIEAVEVIGDPQRIEVREQVNARYLQTGDFAERFDVVVLDVSFISLTKILPVLPPLLARPATVIPLIKPQFEVGRSEVGRGGIVRDPAAQERVVQEICACAAGLGLRSRGVMDSPILGADGNREFLACFEWP